MAAQPSGVDFFARQHAARGTSVKLVVLFVLAVVSIVAAIDLVVVLVIQAASAPSVIGWLVVATVVTLLVIGGGTLTKLIALRAGGVAVAKAVGAVPVDPTTSDPQLRRYVNVVEEMSIASGVPMPRLFVLQSEPGINAFAAGYTPADAAVTVTAGALHQLNRDELQGVIGHEFSHVLNGDMKLNLRLIGLLNGLLLLGLVGLRMLQFGGVGRSRDSNAAPIFVFGIAALILGFIGEFFAGLIKAAVSRQREWLADASSVQFTRQPAGLAGALKKIAGVPTGSALNDTHSEKQINHMLFGEGKRSIGQLWATHPPLLERIKALDPAFDASALAALEQQYSGAPPDGLAEDAQLGLVAAPAAPAAAASHVQLTPGGVSRRVGTFTPDDLARGAALSGQLPADARALATQITTALPLVLALLLDSSEPARERQLALVRTRLAPETANAAAGMYEQVADIAPLLRIPLLGIAMANVVARPSQRLDALVGLLDELALVDGTFTVHEYCLTRLVRGYVQDALDPARRSRPGRATVPQEQHAAVTLLAVVAAAGNDTADAAQRAFAAGVAALGLPPQPFQPPRDFVSALDAVWAPLDALDPRHKKPLIEAITAAVAEDGKLAVAEAELLRTACSLVHCPLPALLS